MAQKGIREYHAKKLFSQQWDNYFKDFNLLTSSILVHSGSDLERETLSHKWIKDSPLVVKPDMLFGKRGKNNLVFFKNKESGDVFLDSAKKWIDEKTEGETVLICGSKGKLSTFIVEPFVPHSAEEEYYISATTETEGDVLYFSTSGGVNIEENWDKVHKIHIPLDGSNESITELISKELTPLLSKDSDVVKFATVFYLFFKEMFFSYLELNPFILRNKDIYLLDVVAKIDDTAHFLLQDKWGDLEYPNPFGLPQPSKEEQEIQKIDANSGASLKLSILNPNGLVWTLVAGGGASVVYADCIAQYFGPKEMANYGEYSGNPTKNETFQYASYVLDLMTRTKDSQGRDKILLIGGSIANFTDVAKTFEGIIEAFEKYHKQMKEVGVKIYVRRGGPNYEIGLQNIEAAATRLGLSIKVFGPETHITDIVRLSQLEIMPV